MDFYWNAPVWEDKDECPNTCVSARPIRSTNVRNKRVIYVEQAKYRNASISGHFVLAEEELGALPKTGWCKVEVYCLWFGHRLKTRGIQITVNAGVAKVHKDYSGDVVSNIGR